MVVYWCAYIHSCLITQELHVFSASCEVDVVFVFVSVQRRKPLNILRRLTVVVEDASLLHALVLLLFALVKEGDLVNVDSPGYGLWDVPIVGFYNLVVFTTV